MKEYYKRYRPKTLSDVMGQESAMSSINRLVEKGTVPHAIMLTGPSGTGKTTIGRILARTLQCAKLDYHEKDCTTEEKPLDFVRNLGRTIQLSPMGGSVTVWFLEEFQSLSRAGFSQQALLKVLEDTPSHVYFILATTDPQKIHKAIHTRCYEIKLNALKPGVMEKLLQKVIAGEKLKVSEDVVEQIVEAAEGSARKALVILEQIGSLSGDDEQIAAIQSTTVTKSEAISLARALINPKSDWSLIAGILRDLGEAEAESVRYLILGYARSVMLGGGGLAPRAFRIIDVFSSNFYDSKQAGLAAACWEVVCLK